MMAHYKIADLLVLGSVVLEVDQQRKSAVYLKFNIL